MQQNTPLEIQTIVDGFSNQTLAKEAWTHEAHLVTGLWHVLNYGYSSALEKMRVGIKIYNESVGGVNSETSGYHESITVFWLWLCDEYQKYFSTEKQQEANIYDDFLRSKYVDRNLPFLFYSRDKLLSVEARMNFVAPDILPFNFEVI